MEQFGYPKKVGEAIQAEREFKQSFATNKDDLDLRDKLYIFLNDPKRKGGLLEYLGLEATDEELNLFVEATELCLRQNWVSNLNAETEDQKKALDFLIKKAMKKEPRAA